MSYEGSEEFLCSRGHFWEVDALTLMNSEGNRRTQMLTCPLCQCAPVLNCSVDYTNGSEEDIPETCPGPKEQIGFDDKECFDHYGNRYFVKLLRYKSLDSNRWKPFE